MNLSDEVKIDMKNFISLNFSYFKDDAIRYGELDLTFAVSHDGCVWNYQTGGNSFTGGAYGLPHWAVTTVYNDSSINDILDDVFDQFEQIEVYEG